MPISPDCKLFKGETNPHTWEAASHNILEHGLWRWTNWAQVQHDPYVSQGRLERALLTDHSQMYSFNIVKVCLFAHAECPTQYGSRPIIIMVMQKPRLMGERGRVHPNTYLCDNETRAKRTCRLKHWLLDIWLLDNSTIGIFNYRATLCEILDNPKIFRIFC